MSDTWSLVTQRFGFLRNVLSKQLIHSSTRNYSFFLPKIQSLLKPAFYVASCSVVGLWSDKAPKRQGKYIVWPRIAGLMKKKQGNIQTLPFPNRSQMWNVPHCHKGIYFFEVRLGARRWACSHFTVCSKAWGMCRLTGHHSHSRTRVSPWQLSTPTV